MVICTQHTTIKRITLASIHMNRTLILNQDTERKSILFIANCIQFCTLTKQLESMFAHIRIRVQARFTVYSHCSLLSWICVGWHFQYTERRIYSLSFTQFSHQIRIQINENVFENMMLTRTQTNHTFFMNSFLCDTFIVF